MFSPLGSGNVIHFIFMMTVQSQGSLAELNFHMDHETVLHQLQHYVMLTEKKQYKSEWCIVACGLE
jgi:hypothetical protein